MIKNNKLSIDPATKENIKNKIKEEIQKMKLAETKGDNEAIEKIMILNERIRLIDSYRPFDQIRIANLQKMFKHYSTHVFKTGKNMTFQQIQYENEHMTLQRFFVFINDFKLNEIPVDDVNRQLTDRNNIILLFKKCSYNSRYLEFHQFITALQRLFVLLFNQTQNFDRRQQKLKEQKLKRAKQSKRREQLRAKKRQKKKMQKYMDKPSNQKEEEEQQEEEEEEGEVQVTQNNKTNQIKSEVKSKPNEQTPPVLANPALPKSTENDEMVKQMMKDFQIVNPTDEVKKAVKKVKNNKKVKKQQEQQEQQQVQIQVQFDPYAITDEEKIQSYMLRLGVDNFKNIEKKMRYFQKANEKYHQVDLMEKALEIKRQKLKVLKKDQLTHYQNGEIHPQWKGNKRAKQQMHIKSLLGVRDKIEQLKMSQSRSHMIQSLPKDVYERKKKSIIETFERKQRQLMVPYALARLTKRKEQEQQNTLHYSLEMIHRSTPNQLPLNKINPEKYAVSDPSDHIFMEEYGYDSVTTMRAKPHRSDSKLAEDTKRRAQQLQNQQQKKMNLLSRNMYKKQKHYNRQSTILDKHF